MRKDAKEIKFYELPDYDEFIKKYPDIVSNKMEYREFRILYSSIDLTSLEMIKRFYNSYWKEHRGKIPGKDTAKLYQEFLINVVLEKLRQMK